MKTPSFLALQITIRKCEVIELHHLKVLGVEEFGGHGVIPFVKTQNDEDLLVSWREFILPTLPIKLEEGRCANNIGKLHPVNLLYL